MPVSDQAGLGRGTARIGKAIRPLSAPLLTVANDGNRAPQREIFQKSEAS